MKKSNLLLLTTALVGLGSIGISSIHSSADSVSKVVTKGSQIFNETPLSISYPDGTWGDVSPNSQPVTGQYDSQNHKLNLKISSPATRFNGNPPTFMYNLIYKVTGNETGKVYLSGQDSVLLFPGMDSLNLEFTDSGNQDQSYKVDATSIEVLEGIHPPVFPYTKDGHALVTK